MENLKLFDKIPIFEENDLISLQLISTSKGNQNKWYEVSNNYFIKEQFFFQGQYWKDYLVEKIATVLAKQMKILDKNVEVLPQEICLIKKKDGRLLYGVYSKNFCGVGEKYVSLQNHLESTGSQFPIEEDLKSKWDFIFKIMKSIIQKDPTDYLIVMSILDYLVGNEDRHLNNIGFIKTDDHPRFAPLFDFGLGLFEHDLRYSHEPFQKCLSMMESKPFASDNQKLIEFIRTNYDIKRYLPDKFDLSGVEIPSGKAGSYILNRCKSLEIEVQGID